MKQQLQMNGVDVQVEINPPKLYGKIFTDWVEEKYRGVLPKLTIEKVSDKIWFDSFLGKPYRFEHWRVSWRYENDFCMGNSKTIRMKCRYNYDGSIGYISFSEGYIDRGSNSYIQTERGLKISIRNIEKTLLENPRYRGNPSYYSEETMWSSKFDN